jgi:hypothetical protein
MAVVVDPGGSFAIVRAIVRVRGTGIAPGIWHVGMFVNGSQVAQKPFENKDWQTYELPLVTINRGDTVDVRIYIIPGEATAPGQICEWRLVNMCHVGCDPYFGGPLEGFIVFDAQVPCDSCAAAADAALFAAPEEGGGDFVDPSLWGPGDDLGDGAAPPWEALDEPWDPGPGPDLQFQPYPPA